MKRYNGIAGIKQWALLLALWVLAVDAVAGERVALVIGNDSYPPAWALKNAISDAKRVGDALEKDLGFSRVIRKNNVKHSQWLDALDELGKVAAGADWVVVYYAGHGIQVQGKNYLIPVDVELKGEGDLRRTVLLDDLLTEVNRAQKLGLVILDACRDNPFAARLNQGAGRSVAGRGLARVERTGSNTLVAFATQEGAIAADSGVYAAALVQYLATPGLEVERLFGKVRDEVMVRTGNAQKPFIYGSLGGGSYAFKPGPPPDGSGNQHLDSWKNFQNNILSVTEAIKTSFKNWVLIITGLVTLLVMMGFALMYRHVRVANQSPFNSRILSRMIREKISRSYYNLSHRHTLWSKEKAIQPQPQLQPQMPPTPKMFYRLVPQRNDRGLPTLILPKPGNYRLGRMQADNIQLVVPSQYVSSEHLVIIVNPDYSIAVENLKPTNKTHIAGVEVSPGQICPIQPGQTLRLGHDEVIYSLQKG